MKCKICQADSDFFAKETILQRHLISYFRCTRCGFIQTEEPFWLAEAYQTAINRSDVGLVQRNLMLAKQATVIISSWFDHRGKFVDFGGGYGLFTRLMRDRGYDFFRSDPHCENLFARGFDAENDGKGSYELLTAFEVFEHLANPLGEVERMLSYSSSILFSTELLPVPVPRPEAWWYYGLDHGQHISFYTTASLQTIAHRFNLRLYSNGSSLHLLTPGKIMPCVFALMSRYSAARLIDALLPKRPLTAADYKAITGREPF